MPPVQKPPAAGLEELITTQSGSGELFAIWQSQVKSFCYARLILMIEAMWRRSDGDDPRCR